MRIQEKYEVAEEIVEEKILEAIVPGGGKASGSSSPKGPFDFILSGVGYKSQKEEYEENRQKKLEDESANADASDASLARDQIRQQLRDGKLEDQYIEIEVTDAPKNNIDLACLLVGFMAGVMMAVANRVLWAYRWVPGGRAAVASALVPVLAAGAPVYTVARLMGRFVAG